MSEKVQTELFDSHWPIRSDELCHWLFRAAEKKGKADPFQIRELADGVWHFLQDEYPLRAPTQLEVLETTIKVLRELGESALSGWLESDLCQFDSNDVSLPNNLIAAHNAGVVRIGTLQPSSQLVGGPLRLHPDSSPESMRNYYQFATLDGEQLFDRRRSLNSAVAHLHQLRAATSLNLIVNLNREIMPWSEVSRPSLFAVDPLAEPVDFPDIGQSLPAAAAALMECRDGLSWRWHLHERDFERPSTNRLRRICASSLASPGWTIVLNRRHQVPVSCHGLFPDDPGVLQTATLDLKMFLFQLNPHQQNTTEFIAKLPSLARLVLEVGHHSQAILRRANFGLRPPDLIERSVLLVDVRGMAEVARQLSGDASTRFAHDTLTAIVQQRLTDVLNHDPQGLQVRYGIVEPVGTSHQNQIDLCDRSSSIQSIREVIESDPFIDRIRVNIDPNHPLAADRLMHLLHGLFAIHQVRAVDIQRQTELP